MSPLIRARFAELRALIAMLWGAVNAASTAFAGFVADVVNQLTFAFTGTLRFPGRVAVLRQIPTPAGTTLQLPANPSNGDEYRWSDGDGSCSPSSVVTLTAVGGATVRNGAAVRFNTPFSWAVATFDAANNDWVLETGYVLNASLAQTTWHVNYVTGKVNNDGLTAGTAVPNVATIMSRWQAGAPGTTPTLAPGTVNIFIDSAVPGGNQFGDPLGVLANVNGSGAGVVLVVQGTAPTQVHAGTLNTVSAFARTSAAGQILITDLTVADYGPFTPNLFHDITTGGVGWLRQPAVGANATGTITRARTAQTAGTFGGFPTPVTTNAGDSYELIALTSVYMGENCVTNPNGQGPLGLFFYRLHFLQRVNFEGCLMGNTNVISTFGDFIFIQECYREFQIRGTNDVFEINCGSRSNMQCFGAGFESFAGFTYTPHFLSENGNVVLDGDFVTDVLTNITSSQNAPISTARGFGTFLQVGTASYWATNSTSGAFLIGIKGSSRFQTLGDGANVLYGTVGAANPCFNLRALSILQLATNTAVNTFNFENGSTETFQINSKTAGFGFNTTTGLFVGPTNFRLDFFDAALAAGTGFGSNAQDPQLGGWMTTYNG